MASPLPPDLLEVQSQLRQLDDECAASLLLIQSAHENLIRQPLIERRNGLINCSGGSGSSSSRLNTTGIPHFWGYVCARLICPEFEAGCLGFKEKVERVEEPEESENPNPKAPAESHGDSPVLFKKLSARSQAGPSGQVGSTDSTGTRRGSVLGFLSNLWGNGNGDEGGGNESTVQSVTNTSKRRKVEPATTSTNLTNFHLFTTPLSPGKALPAPSANLITYIGFRKTVNALALPVKPGKKVAVYDGYWRQTFECEVVSGADAAEVSPKKKSKTKAQPSGRPFIDYKDIDSDIDIVDGHPFLPLLTARGMMTMPPTGSGSTLTNQIGATADVNANGVSMSVNLGFGSLVFSASTSSNPGSPSGPGTATAPSASGAAAGSASATSGTSTSATLTTGSAATATLTELLKNKAKSKPSDGNTTGSSSSTAVTSTDSYHIPLSPRTLIRAAMRRSTELLAHLRDVHLRDNLNSLGGHVFVFEFHNLLGWQKILITRTIESGARQSASVKIVGEGFSYTRHLQGVSIQQLNVQGQNGAGNTAPPAGAGGIGASIVTVSPTASSPSDDPMSMNGSVNLPGLASAVEDLQNQMNMIDPSPKSGVDANAKAKSDPYHPSNSFGPRFSTLTSASASSTIKATLMKAIATYPATAPDRVFFSWLLSDVYNSDDFGSAFRYCGWCQPVAVVEDLLR